MNWNEVVPGDKSIYLWNDYIPYNDLPQIENPAGGFIYSCNNTPYLCTDDPKDFPNRLPKNTGIDTHQTNRALRALELYGKDKNISREEFLSYKYDKQYSKDSHIANVLEKFIMDSNQEMNERKDLIIHSVINGKSKLVESISNDYKTKPTVIRFLKNADEILCVDNEKKRKIKKKHIATLPNENAQELISNKIATKIRLEE